MKPPEHYVAVVDTTGRLTSAWRQWASGLLANVAFRVTGKRLLLIEAANDTTITLSLLGSDGVRRTTTLTLS